MTSSYLSSLIDRRYPESISLVQAQINAGLSDTNDIKNHAKTNVNLSAKKKKRISKRPTNIKELKKIEEQLRIMEAKLYESSEDYKELVKFENSWKRLQTECAKIKKNNNNNYVPKKRPRSNDKDDAFQEVEEVDDVSQEVLVQERVRFDQLQKVLLDNHKKQTEFMNSFKDFMERILKKVNRFHEISQLRKNQSGKHLTISSTHLSNEKNGIGEEYKCPDSRHNDPFNLKSISSKSTSSSEHIFHAAFGSISFSTGGTDFVCTFIITLIDECLWWIWRCYMPQR